MNVFDLAARLTLDSSEYDEGLESSEKKASTFGNKIGKGLATAVKIGGAVLATASAAVGSLVKNSIENYAEYEQLVGGVETLFKASADTVQAYAANAYKTAGLSANEYMETVTSFSASLLQSLDGDTQAAAAYADRAITDMSDNANKMGSSMESIQTAYQGFAKQNYTMLDNLKLGYGGTKSEMERLIEDAERLDDTFTAARDENGALAMSYADIVDAIHIVQTNLDITGTTAKEASTTIQGSLSATKSAWSNLITGIADENADFETLVGNMVDSVVTVGNNLMPRIEQALQGVGKLVEGLAPVVANALPGLIQNVLPAILSAAASLITTVSNALISNLPMILRVGLDLILTLANGIVDALPDLVPSIIDVILQIVEVLTEPDTLIPLLDAALAIMIALAEGLLKALPDLLKAIPVIVQNLIESLSALFPSILSAGADMLREIVKGLLYAIPDLLNAAGTLVMNLINGIVGNYTKLFNTGSEVLNKVKEGIMVGVEKAKQWGKDLIDNFISGITAKWEDLKSTVSNVANTVKDFLGFSEPKLGPLSDFHTFAPDMMKLFAEGIKDNTHLITDQIAKSFDINAQMAGGLTPSSSSVGGAAATANNSFTINVYGSEGQSVTELAAEVEKVITRMMRSREAVWA